MALNRAESAGDVRAISPAGALGLMQVMPATWADLRARHGLGRYDEYLATGRALPPETRAYVAALAPVLGGAVTDEAPAPAPPPPPDWREAGLFVPRSADTRTVAAPSSEARAGDGGTP